MKIKAPVNKVDRWDLSFEERKHRMKMIDPYYDSDDEKVIKTNAIMNCFYFGIMFLILVIVVF